MRKLFFTCFFLLGLTVGAQAYTALEEDITSKGMYQRDLVIFLQNVVDALNETVDDHATNRTFMTETETLIEELHDDHATFKTAVDNTETLIEELHDDHATFKTAVDATETLIEELHDDHATFKTVVDDLKTLQAKLEHRPENFVITTSPVLAIDTNFDVKNTEQTTFVAGTVFYTLDDNVSCDTGTSKTLTSSQWGAFIVEAGSASSLTCTWAASEYASEASALAAAKALTPTASKATIGFVTVQAHASGFTAGTDALTTGTGGNVANATNYYSLAVSDFAAVASSSPATLGTSKPASGPATLSASKPASGPATLTAPKPASPAAALTNSTDLTLSAP